MQRLRNGHAHHARVTEAESGGRLGDQHRSPIRIVGMDQAIHQGLAQRLMGWRIVHAHPVFQHERHFQVHRQLADHPPEKIVQIARPRPVGHHPIEPAGLRAGVVRMLLIIHKIQRKSLGNGWPAAKHQQPGCRQARDARGTILPPATDHAQKCAIVQRHPRVLWPMHSKCIAVSMQAV